MLATGLLVLPLMNVSAAELGAYQDAAIDENEVKAAADFAVKERGKHDGVALQLKAIVTAEKQIVAGTNYQLMLMVSEGNSESA